MAADVNRMSWLVDSGLSSFVTAATDGSAYTLKTIRDGAVAMARVRDTSFPSLTHDVCVSSS